MGGKTRRTAGELEGKVKGKLVGWDLRKWPKTHHWEPGAWVKSGYFF